MVRPLNKVYPDGVGAEDNNTTCKLKGRYWAAIIIFGLLAFGVVVYVSIATYTVDISLPRLRTRRIHAMSVKDNKAHTSLLVSFKVPFKVSVSPQLGTFVLSTKVNKTLTIRAVANNMYDISEHEHTLLLEFLSRGFSSLNKSNDGGTLTRLDGDFKMNVKPTNFPLIPKAIHHVKFVCRFLLKGVKLDQVDHQQCDVTSPTPSGSWH